MYQIHKFMEQNKKQILLEPVEKLNEVLLTLEANFDCENENSDKYSFLSTIKGNLTDWAKR